MRLGSIFTFLRGLRFHFFASEISRLEKCDILLFCHDNDRSLTLNGLAYSPLIDSISEQLSKSGLRCQSVALPWSQLGRKDTFGRAVLINRYYFLQLALRAFLGFVFFNVYELVLKKSEARLVIGIGLTSDLCCVAKKYNVTTIEVLHGMGYTFVPWGMNDRPRENLPDQIVAMDPVSKVSFSSLLARGVQVRQVVHPFYNKILDAAYNIPREWHFEGNPTAQNVLITLQWGYDGEEPEFNGVLANGVFFEELEILISKRQDKFWHFRLHPVHVKGGVSSKAQRYVSLLAARYPNVSWRTASTVPLASVASACDAHLTMCSMSCYEVAMYGVPSLVFCPTTRGTGVYRNYFEDLVGEGYVNKSAFDAAFVEGWLDAVLRMPPRSISETSSSWLELVSEFKLDVEELNVHSI